MSGTFLSGVLCAWAAAQLGMGAFFVLAYFAGRREPEYAVFGVLCFSLSVMSIGVGLDYHDGTQPHGILADQIGLSGAIFAAPLNVHFALCFSSLEDRLRRCWPLYLLAFFFFVANWSGAFWVPGKFQIVQSTIFGVRVDQMVGEANVVGNAFYAVGVLETLATVGILARAYLAGRRDALASLLGISLVVPAVVNDAGLAFGAFRNTISLLPHAFLVFAFAVAGTVLMRYRLAAGGLEQTTQRLQLRTDELRTSHAELRVVQSELVSKNQLAAVGELAAAIAHEVRNPLAVIVNAVAGLRRVSGSEEDRNILLGIVDEEAARLNRLVTDLLRFARPVSVKRSPVSLGELAKRSRSQIMDGHEIVVSIAADPEIQTVWVDPNLFRLVFDNLVQNACQAMQGGGRVDIVVTRGELSSKGPAVSIQIKDHGHGMEPEVRERALDPFFTTRPSGTGLGLPIVQRIVEAHGGELLIESEEGAGTSITLFLPLGAPAEEPLAEGDSQSHHLA
ncbi:MAG TPA: ATP-binding protein [Polyangiaceae bacterium]|nr:ATP-binding protein [Polyangiaceae bacterium]